MQSALSDLQCISFACLLLLMIFGSLDVYIAVRVMFELLWLNHDGHCLFLNLVQNVVFEKVFRVTHIGHSRRKQD